MSERKTINFVLSLFEKLLPLSFTSAKTRPRLLAMTGMAVIYIKVQGTNKPGWQILHNIIDLPDNYTMDLTSDPLHVCDCTTENSRDCINVVGTIQTVHTYPGKPFNLSLLAVGQLLNTSTLSGVPTAIYAGLLPLHNKSGIIPDTMQVQRGERNCSNLT